MPAASLGALLINTAATREGIEKATISACPTRQGKQAVFEVEMFDQARLAQASGNLLGCFMLGFKGRHEIQAHQIRKPDFHRHRAAVGGTMSAQTIAIPGPGIEPIDISQV